MAEMIAMLDGLGAYGENPIGDVDPRLLPARQLTAGHKSMEGKVPTYSPKPYTLGADSDRPAMGTGPKVLIALGVATIAYALLQKTSPPAPAAVAGYPEPEMIDSIGAKPARKRRRKKRK